MYSYVIGGSVFTRQHRRCIRLLGASAAALLQLGINFGPFEADAAADLVIRDPTASHPVVDGARGFLEAKGEFFLGDVRLFTLGENSGVDG